MKNRVLANVLLLAVLVSACDTEGVFEPVQGDVPAPVSDKAVLQQETIQINQVIGESEGVAQLYQASGLITYTMQQGPGNGASCQGYTIHATIDGVVSPLPSDQVLWTFQGEHVESICMGGAPYAMSLTCPLEGREDGALLRLEFSVTASGMGLDGLSIEVPSADITPVAD